MFQRRSRSQKDFEDEIKSHIALETDRLIGEGMNPIQARLEAIRRFGSVVTARERFYESRRVLWLEHFRRDFRYALAQFSRSPGFIIVAVLTLAIGIGANTAIFSIVDGVLLRPLPYTEPQHLVAIWDKSVRGDEFDKEFDSYSDFEHYAKSSETLEVAAATWAGTSLRIMKGQGPAEAIMVIPVSESFFRLLGVPPFLGRTFDPSDVNQGCSVVLSHSFWMESFHSRSDIAGQNIVLDDEACQVLGVMPAHFSFYPDNTPLWVLITPTLKLQVAQVGVGVFGRLKPGATINQAQSEIRAIHQSLHQSDGKERRLEPIVLDLQGEFTWLASRNLRATVWALFAAVNVVLLIACLNVGSLLLGRSLSREKEMAVRMALGSGRGRLIRQLLTEALLLSVLGGGAGVALAALGIRYFETASPVELPVGAMISIHPAELIFALTVSIATAFVFGLTPALKVSGIDLNVSLKGTADSSTSAEVSHGLAAALVILQAGLAVVLLTSSGLLMSSVLKLSAAAYTFDADHIFAAYVRLPAKPYSDETKRFTFYHAIQERLNRLIGVSEVALTSGLPPFGDTWGNKLEVEDHRDTDDSTDVSNQSISPNYFRLMAEPLYSGRQFDDRDQLNSEPVAVVNEALVRRYFPHENPLGIKIRIGDRDSWSTIVGVVANEKYSSLQEMTWIERPVVFRPVSQDPRQNMMIAIRTASDQASIGKSTQQAIASLDSNVPVPKFDTLRSQLSRYVFAYPRFRMTVLSAFAGFALLLTAIGIYGLMACSVQRRRREIGIRMALGARAEDVRRMVILHGVRLTAVGFFVGLLGAFAATRLIKNFLYGVGTTEPTIFISVPIVLTAVTLLAVWLPARRATHIDPIVTLRSE